MAIWGRSPNPEPPLVAAAPLGSDSESGPRITTRQSAARHARGAAAILVSRLATWYADRLVERGDTVAAELWPTLVACGLTSPARLVESSFRSPEFRLIVAPIVRLYFAALGRPPDVGGLRYWAGKLRVLRSMERLAESFAHSREFRERYGGLGNRRFVEATMEATLGAAVAADGLDFWTAMLDEARATRGSYLLGISEHPDFRARIVDRVRVTAMYLSLLRRHPDSEGLDYWVACARDGDSWAAIIDAFLQSRECRTRFPR